MSYIGDVCVGINFYVYGQDDLKGTIHRHRTFLRKETIYCETELQEKKLSGKEEMLGLLASSS